MGQGAHKKTCARETGGCQGCEETVRARCEDGGLRDRGESAAAFGGEKPGIGRLVQGRVDG
jgi:hypothetical protein